MSATADPFHEGLHPGGYSVPGDEGKHFIAAASGVPINLLEPDPEVITLADVARGLAMTCRFAGQVDHFYSVAEHSVFVHDLLENIQAGVGRVHTAPLLAQRSAILHDAPEAYIHDLTGPLKRALQILGGNAYAEIEARWTEAVRVRFALPVPDVYTVRAVKRLDHRAACLEGGRIKRLEPFYQGFTTEPLPDGVECKFGLTPMDAELLFLSRCERLGIR